MDVKKRHESTLARVCAVRAITVQHYEAGNRQKCYKAVWRRHVYPVFRICYRTYLNYLGIPAPAHPDRPRQLSLF